MKRKIIFPGLLLAVILVQCSKRKDENSGPDLKKGLLAYFPLNGGFFDSASTIKKISYFYQPNGDVADRKGIKNRAKYYDTAKFWFEPPEPWAANPISISLWVKPKDDKNENFFLLSNDKAFGFFQNDANIGFVISSPVTNSAMTNFGYGWLHIVGTYDGKNIRTYINGELKKTVEHPGEPDMISKIEIGSVSSPCWKGTIDDIRFYNRILTEEEIAILANL